MSQPIALNSSIEHTLLKPDCTIAEIEQVCTDAIKYGFGAVCIPSYFLEHAVNFLGDAPIDIATVVGFPYGYNSTMSKFEETEDALMRGADHIDVVINIAAVKNNDWETVENEIETLLKLVKRENKIIKIIIEASIMTETETDLICTILNELKPDYAKTSTGINGAGADVEMIHALRKQLHSSIKIKASGGIKTREQAIELIVAGADRIGTSRGVEIATGIQSGLN